MPFNLSEIYIPVSNELRTTFDTKENQGIFDENENFLRIIVQPGGYKSPTIINDNEVIRGFASSIVLLPQHFYEFEATTLESRIALVHVLEGILKESQINNHSYTPITVRDYCQVNAVDLAQGYTERSGILKYEVLGIAFKYEVSGIAFSEDNTVYTKGVRIIFNTL